MIYFFVQYKKNLNLDNLLLKRKCIYVYFRCEKSIISHLELLFREHVGRQHRSRTMRNNSKRKDKLLLVSPAFVRHGR